MKTTSNSLYTYLAQEHNKILRDARKARMQAGLPVWQRWYVIMLVTLAAICMDFTTILSAYDATLSDDYTLLIVMAVSTCDVLDTIPTIIAKRLALPKTRMNTYILTALATLFVSAFLLTFALRFTGRFDATAAGSLNINIPGIENTTTVSTATNITYILTGFIPLLSSAIVFAVSYPVDVDKKKRAEFCRNQNEDLTHYRDELAVLIHELEYYQDYDIRELDRAHYDNALDKCDIYEELLQIIARRKLCEKLKTHNASDRLLSLHLDDDALKTREEELINQLKGRNAS